MHFIDLILKELSMHFYLKIFFDLIVLNMSLLIFSVKEQTSLWWHMLNYSNHFVCLNPTSFLQPTSTTDVPMFYLCSMFYVQLFYQQSMDRTMITFFMVTSYITVQKKWSGATSVSTFNFLHQFIYMIKPIRIFDKYELKEQKVSE